jgi:hypothetical protein
MNTQRVFQTPEVKPLHCGEHRSASSGVVLRLTAGDAERVVRALEEASVRLSGLPSGSRSGGAYRRLAGVVRHQVRGGGCV